MGNLTEFALQELSILRETCPDHIALEFEDAILKLVSDFAESGQSGGSAPYTANAILETLKKLMAFEPASKITGNDEEWANSFNDVLQNTRCYGLFKKGDVCTFNNGIVYKEESGSSYTGRTNNISSMVEVKEFPFEPGYFYIDVYKIPLDFENTFSDFFGFIEDADGSKWLYLIKDYSQLEKVREKYNLIYGKEPVLREPVSNETVNLPEGFYASLWSAYILSIISGQGKRIEIKTIDGVKGRNCPTVVYVDKEGKVYVQQ